MIKEIVLNKKYKVLGQEYTRTPLCIHNGLVFYEHNCCNDLSCSISGVEDFKRGNEEIPEATEEWFEVIHKVKGVNTRPVVNGHLFRSKADFLNYREENEAEFEFVKLRKVEL